MIHTLNDLFNVSRDSRMKNHYNKSMIEVNLMKSMTFIQRTTCVWKSNQRLDKSNMCNHKTFFDKPTFY